MKTQYLRTSIGLFDQAKVLVIGDPIRDVYAFGRVERLSQEAPVPVFLTERFEERQGGCLNVVSNLAALGAQVSSLTPLHPWTRKLRYMVGHQQLLRVDDDQWKSPVAVDLKTLFEIEKADVLVLSDYAKGALGQSNTQAMIKHAREKSTVVIVDPKGSDWSKYQGAHILCPNIAEVNAWGGTAQGKSLDLWNLPHDLIVKRGEKGLRVHQRLERISEVITDLPARARHVFDVTGAGDTVIAVLAAAIAVHVDLLDAAYLANLAAGVVVGEVGTVVCTREQLLGELARSHQFS